MATTLPSRDVGVLVLGLTEHYDAAIATLSEAKTMIAHRAARLVAIAAVAGSPVRREEGGA